MRTETVPDKLALDQWRVEDVDDKTGECYVVVFSGPLAKERAELYGRLDPRWRIPKKK